MAPVTRILLTAFAVITLIIGAGVYLSVRDRNAPAAAQPRVADAGQVVRDNSHRLNNVPDSDVTFVEFLDFECEGCRAAFPMVEQLRSEYGDRVNFVIRYFPLQSHFNAERAARAVEAAAQQGKLEPMYKKMYEMQAEWGEQRIPADDVFRGFATELGLDMLAFDAAYNNPATLERINQDVADGNALGVQGTPTFFLNGARIQPKGYEDLAAAVDQALAGQ
ncbi:thioredoxin domain-containing protein [Mycolicibacterium novocastrense]|uniref:DSBA oxidoreductase n=1 Tax=Mycolicibacterium novocastrense TaxID=59813 RepID=A0AAW5SPI6_MYCNV|nr:thioredoxin domain-containing protein [Mycolicibacterium novocastrense]MCV7025638.1 thioredoxin domain-containing protein [Mycolicibacterium novocastrense]GAT07936.1 DSBA oxidoreductase [Mycolicibacterium novocastrense]